MPTSIPYSSLRKIPLAYATCSIGCSPSDSLPRKLEAISNAGFTAVELSFPDLRSYASQLLNHRVADNDYPELCAAAREIKGQCQAANLDILMLQPFANFEGWPTGSRERSDAFSRANGWIRIMEACGTDMLQLGATDSPAERISTQREDIIRDLRELTDMLAARNMRLAYENWCWSTHAPTWQDVWEIVKAVDRPNIGLCLDIFQTAGSEWADPTTSSGLIEEPGLSPPDLDRRFIASLDNLTRSVPPERIYLLQVSDAYKANPPLEKRIINNLRPRARWSHDLRPMPYIYVPPLSGGGGEGGGGYLPIEDVARAVLRTGFRGHFSMEIFDSGPDGKGRKYDLMSFAQQAQVSMQKLLMNCATDTT